MIYINVRHHDINYIDIYIIFMVLQIVLIYYILYTINIIK